MARTVLGASCQTKKNETDGRILHQPIDAKSVADFDRCSYPSFFSPHFFYSIAHIKKSH
jgi:hypothetical protein